MLILLTSYVLDVDLMLVDYMLDVNIVIDLCFLGIFVLNYYVSDLVMLCYAYWMYIDACLDIDGCIIMILVRDVSEMIWETICNF